MTRRNATSVWLVYEEIFNTPTRYQTKIRAYDTALGHITAAQSYIWHLRIASRPWNGSTTNLTMWLHSDGSITSDAEAEGAWAAQRRFTLTTLAFNADTPDGFGVFIEAELSPDERASAEQSFHVPEVAFRSHTDEAGASVQRAYFPALSVIRTQSSTVELGTAALVLYEWDTEAGTDARARRVAELGGQGLVFGGGLQEIQSARLNYFATDTFARGAENGFVFAPAILSADPTATGADGLTSDELYQFFAIFEYITPDGLRVRSAPSNIVAATPTAGSLNVELKITTCPTSEREFSSPPNATVAHVYGTTAGGNTFRRITPDTGLDPARGDSSTGLITFVHSRPDVDVIANEPAYTEGGGIPNQPCPGHRFGWVGGGYAWVGGLFNGQIVERSKLSVPNEPTQFTRDNTHRVLLPERCTGGAWLDNVSVLFTRSGIYVVPATLAAPQRLPSTVGCVDFRSIIEMPDGLGFQSARGYEIMPRGFGSPRLISGPVQDALRGRRVISATVTGNAGSDFADAAHVGERLLVLFAIDPSLMSDPGVRLVYDLDLDRWISIDPAFANSFALGEHLTTWQGRLVAASRSGTNIRIEDPTDWGSVEDVPMSITLADLRPFGLMSRGNVRRFQLLGEYRDASKIEAEISIDGTYSETDEMEVHTMHDEAGDKFLEEWEMPVRDVNAFGLAFTVTTTTDEPNEGLVFHALGLEGEGLPGRPRPRGERRA
jgi:hypothetical protein